MASRKMPSVAPVDIVGITGTPGKYFSESFIAGSMIFGSSGGGMDKGRRGGVGQLINRVFANGYRTMAARIGGFDTKILYRFLAYLHRLADDFPVTVGIAAAFIDREFGSDQFRLVLREPLRAIEREGGFFAASQRHFDRAVRHIVAFLELHQHVGPDGRHRLVICGAASIEISIRVKGSRVQSSRFVSTTSI